MEYGDYEYKYLEKDLEKWSGESNVVACSSGTAALHLALEAFEIHNVSNREVIIPDYTMYACARAVSLAGMVPVPVDCRRNDLLINPELVEAAISKKTCAIMAVHNYGRLCDMVSINTIARKYELLVIEDMAEAHGCPVDPGTDVACWSFYKNKVVHGEEGGALSFKDKGAAEYARKLRSLGFNEPHDYSHVPRGHNYRMSNVHAALIRRSLWEYKICLSRRRYIESCYDKICPAEWKMPERASPWVYDLRIPGMTEITQNKVITRLREEGIQARHGFKPIGSQPEYRYLKRFVGGESDRAAREVIYLPIQPGVINEKWCQRAFDVIKSVVGSTR